MTTNGPIAQPLPRLRLRISDENAVPSVRLVDPEGKEHEIAQDAAVVSATITGEGSDVWVQLRADLEDWSFGINDLNVGVPKLTPDDYETIKGFLLYSQDYTKPTYDLVWDLLVERGLAAPLG